MFNKKNAKSRRPLSKALCFKRLESAKKYGGVISTMDNNEEATITDRLALGFGGALTTFVTGLVLWLFFNMFFSSATGTISIPFGIVWGLTIFGFILGALTLENHLLKILTPIWRILWEVITKLLRLFSGSA